MYCLTHVLVIGKIRFSSSETVQYHRYMEILAIIPARGGSKGVPRKNVKMLGGKPLIAHIIETVKSVSGISRVIVSTEDTEIADVARQYGAEVPFVRPMTLAEDDVATLPVLQHTLEVLGESEGYRPDAVLLVYPTSPLLRPSRIDEAISIMVGKDADSVISGTYTGGHYWIEGDGKWQRLYPTDLKNRQYTKKLFKENGAIYLNKTEVLEDGIVAEFAEVLIMDEGENIDIDTLAQFAEAEKIFENK
jgi:CMP-N,N'-diacetyllegionaminic acid synthase